MNGSLHNQACPSCYLINTLRVLSDDTTVQCVACGERFFFAMPELLPPFPFDDFDEIVDHVTRIDIQGNVHREEVSRYVVDSKPVSVLEFNQNAPKTQWVLHRLDKQIKNRRRLNKDIIRRYKKKQET